MATLAQPQPQVSAAGANSPPAPPPVLSHDRTYRLDQRRQEPHFFTAPTDEAAIQYAFTFLDLPGYEKSRLARFYFWRRGGKQVVRVEGETDVPIYS